jgi:hypothetical protein
MARVSDFVTASRAAAKKILDGLQELDGLNDELTANGGQAWLTADAFEGANADVDAAKVVAVVSTTRGELEAVMGQGHRTNLFKVYP